MIRELGTVRLNEMTTATIQEAIHRLKDHGGRRSEAEPLGRPLAPNTVRHMSSLLSTVLSDAERLDVLRIPHPMAKRKPAVLDEGKLQTLFHRARNTRLYPFIVFGCGHRLSPRRTAAMQWKDLDFGTGLLVVSKSLEQTRADFRVKSTKSEDPRESASVVSQRLGHADLYVAAGI